MRQCQKRWASGNCTREAIVQLESPFFDMPRLWFCEICAEIMKSGMWKEVNK